MISLRRSSRRAPATNGVVSDGGSSIAGASPASEVEIDLVDGVTDSATAPAFGAPDNTSNGAAGLAWSAPPAAPVAPAAFAENLPPETVEPETVAPERLVHAPSNGTSDAIRPARQGANIERVSSDLPTRTRRTRRSLRRERPVGVAEAVLRYLPMFLIIVVLVTAASVAVALTRAPTTTAEARLLIGRVDAEARAVPGFAAATEDLASIYARVVTTDAVLAPAAKAANVPIGVARGAIDASPIPGSSIVRIEAKDPDEARAVRLANAAAKGLSGYVAVLNTVDPYSTTEYKQYADAATALAQAQVTQATLQSTLTKLQTLNTPELVAAGFGLDAQIANVQSLLVTATSNTLQAQLRANQLSTAFQNATRGVGDTTPAKVIAPAASQGNDRKRTLELGALLGLVGGVLLGLAVVVLRANGPYLRVLRRNARTVR